jgi:hypothetical protein
MCEFVMNLERNETVCEFVMNLERNETVYDQRLPNNLSKIFLWNTVSDIIIFRIFNNYFILYFQ